MVGSKWTFCVSQGGTYSVESGKGGLDYLTGYLVQVRVCLCVVGVFVWVCGRECVSTREPTVTHVFAFFPPQPHLTSSPYVCVCVLCVYVCVVCVCVCVCVCVVKRGMRARTTSQCCP